MFFAYFFAANKNICTFEKCLKSGIDSQCKMYFVELPDIGQQKLSFYLAVEEYAARHIDVMPLFFYWQVEPTVIFGRNQNIESEVNVEYCKKNNIHLFRRKSGGGCVYADLDNLMLCYIDEGDDVQLTYSNYTTLMNGALRRLGLKVETTGRNDVTIEGKKISGSAFYHIPNGRNIVHSTLLYDTNIDNMVQSITPPSEKLVAKGVESVKSRIGLLKDYTSLPFSQIKKELREMFCGDKVYKLNEKDLKEIRNIEQTYLDPQFLYGDRKHWNLKKRGRIEGCGELEIRMSVRNGIISSVEMGGDFFTIGDVGIMCGAMRGKPLDKATLKKVFDEYPPDNYVRGLDAERLLRMMLE